ncbi:MAG: RHS repeat protein [Burkholderiales bacterium]|jgi:YD repeat-containing protein|nr:RHS repeat protein [Burkholderiales bacterium]
MDYRYQYDKAGNIVQRQTEEGIYQYGYDTLDRLTQAIPPTSLQQNETNPNGLPIEGYGYDAVHCCIDPNCSLLRFNTALACACYTLRDLYIQRGCDKVFPTRKDHPEPRNQALNKYVNCQKALAKCLSCSI